MGDFRQGGRGGFGGGNRGGFRGGDRGGRPSFGGNRGGFGGNRGPVTMHKVICDECKKPCEVPFLPTAGKPVYCNTCFGGKREGGNDRGGDRFPRKSFGGGDYKTPPRTDFGNDVKKVSGEEIKKQIEVLNGKVDKLVKVIEYLIGNKAVSESVKTEAVAKTSPEVVVKEKKAAKKVSKKK